MPYIVNETPNKETFEERHQRLIELITQVKSLWLAGCSEIENGLLAQMLINVVIARAFTELVR